MKKIRLKKIPKILLLILLFTFICFIGIKYFNNEKNQLVSQQIDKQIDNTLNNIGYSNETINLINQKLANEEITDLKQKSKIEELEIFIKEKYYLHKNLERYITYYTTHPDKEVADIISLVNVNADKEAYKDIQKADLSKENLVLVNKYNNLEEKYEPENMLEMNLEYAYKGRNILPEVNEAFIEMYNAAKTYKIDLYVTSAFRSYSYQKYLYNNYLTTYGEEYTNTVSAYPGFSEHQTGLALDILSPGIDMANFENSKAYEWLKENSYKYGFILRYPKDKTNLTGYAFESWHYRYLGKETAKKVYDEDITYDEYYAFYLDK